MNRKTDFLKKAKACAAAILTLFFISVAVSAEEISIALDRDIEAALVSGIVSIGEGKSCMPVIILVTDDEGNMVYIDESYTDSQGKAYFSYYHQKGNGLMTVLAGCGDAAESVTFVHADSEYINAIVEAVKNELLVGNPDADRLKEIYLENDQVLSLDKTVYNVLENKDSVFSAMLSDNENKAQINSVSDVICAFYSAVGIAAVNEKKDAGTVEELIGNELYSPMFRKDSLIPKDENGVCVFDALSGALKHKIYSRVAGVQHNSKKHLSESFCLYTLTEGISFADSWKDVFSLLEAYQKAGFLDIDIDEYKKIDNKSAVAKALMGKNYDTYEHIENAYESETADTSKREYSSSGKVTGGGGGGGKSLSVSVSPGTSVLLNKPTVQPETAKVSVGKLVFEDMAEAKWAIEAVEALHEKGIINGVDEKSFAPNRPVTRAELIKILVGAAKIPMEASSAVFSDVTSDDWYYPYAAAAYNSGLIKGDNEGRLRGADPVSREEMAVMLTRLADCLGIELARQESLTFDDDMLISEWAKDSVAVLKSAEIINGRNGNCFEPLASLTRAEASVAMYRLLSR